jgi:hypothetical protein
MEEDEVVERVRSETENFVEIFPLDNHLDIVEFDSQTSVWRTKELTRDPRY